MRNEEGFPHLGVIDFVHRLVQPNNQVHVLIQVANSDRSLTAGLVPRVQIKTGPPRDVLFVNDSLVRQADTSRPFVHVLNDDHFVVRRFIEIGERVGDLRIIEAGLKADEWLIDDMAEDRVGTQIPESEISWPDPQPEKTGKPSPR